MVELLGMLLALGLAVSGIRDVTRGQAVERATGVPERTGQGVDGSDGPRRLRVVRSAGQGPSTQHVVRHSGDARPGYVGLGTRWKEVG